MASFFDQHRQHLLDSDADGIAGLYHEDAAMISFEFGTKQGRDAIRSQYAEFFDFHGAISSVDVDRKTEDDENLFVEFTMTSERGEFQLINAFVVDSDKARRHFTNVVRGEVEADAAE